jgi:hypothetical protein
MKWYFALFIILCLSPKLSEASSDLAANPVPFPVFLKIGFSSILEFDEAPTRVVLGDSQAFQVERLERSLVLRTLVAYATSNMFVYFKTATPRLFVLTASEDAEPTYFKNLEKPKEPSPAQAPSRVAHAIPKPGVSQVISAKFDLKKDYLTVEVKLAADSTRLLRPSWNLVRLRHLAAIQTPMKLWAQRKDVQKDSSVRARFIFAKPNIPRDLSDSLLIVPIEGQLAPLTLPLRGVSR